jgi:DNA-binding transcriptional LysR family regulator
LKPERELCYKPICHKYSSKNPMTLDLRRIRSFHALAEHGGFGRAAEAVGVSQPTLSAHIAELEAELGVPLVLRTTRRVRLTTLGAKFLARSLRAVEELQHVTVEIRDEASLQRGRVIVASIRVLSAHVVSAAVRRFQLRFPGVIVQVLDDLANNVERYVVDGQADMALAPRPEHAALTYQHLLTEQFLLGSPRSWERPGSAKSPLDLIADSFIAMSPGSNIRRTIDQALATVGVKVRPRFEVRDHNTAVGMVQAGLGVTLLPESAFPKNTGKTLQLAQLHEPRITRDIGLVCPRGVDLTPNAKAFVAILRRVINKQYDN